MTAKHSAHLLLTLFWAQEVVFAIILFSAGYTVLAVFVALVSVGVAAYVLAELFAAFFGAPYVAMDLDRVDAVLKFADLKPGEKLVDMGSGDGRIVLAAAKAGAIAEGWEVNPYLWAYSVWQAWRLGLSGRARFHFGSFWGASFRDMDVVTLFFITDHMPRMQAKLQNELRPGSRVVSFVFSFPDWEHEKMADNTFLYRKH